MGTINLTTWSRSSCELLLALAHSAAGDTSAMMQVRASGASVRSAPRGEVFHVGAHRRERVLTARVPLPLAHHFAHQERRRDVAFTASATRALTTFDWPGNARQLRQVVRAAAARTDVVDARHLDPLIFVPGGHSLNRLEAVERDELIRCLTAPNATVAKAAAELEMSRATVYRKIAQYGIQLPGRSVEH